MRLHWIISGVSLAAAVLLTGGCGDDSPNPGIRAPTPAAADPPSPSPTSALAPPTPVPAGADPLATPDQLTAGVDGQAKDIGAAPPTDAPGLDSNAVKMPTAHSHWLTVEQYDAKVSCQLNGTRQGGYMGQGTTDITMKLHPGPNTLTVTYEPNSSRSWAGVTLTEGEHQPPISPLVTFRQSPRLSQPSTDGDSQPPPVTQTFAFIAR